ncbi:hypothetical protein KVF89_23300 [Nocardioides carbamazepini]|uniref:DUF6602 domain-containing protein n=1 Tax=Nocardioides carbamazepini TaxID=2854259 RepID=UPI002149B040|nr:DUF6602 domain-containing protein [Nocardioides carbamazepini]MCR1785484.1 hypothetical protein [Nocardioides carbamazepini]
MSTAQRPDDLTKFDLRDAYLRRQDQLLAALNVTAGFIDHPSAKGDASEVDWRAMLSGFLPGRYGVGPIFAVDSRGQRSDQIDIAIYDRQYAPLFFETSGGDLVVPAESIYAAFEVKPVVDKEYVEYAGSKVASVRALHRTSAEIRHAGGVYPPQDPADKSIIGGLLAARSDWTDMEGRAATRAITSAEPDRRLDLGLALDTKAFESTAPAIELAYSADGTQLIWFALRLFRRLQRMGTALAIDLDEYEKALE